MQNQHSSGRPRRLLPPTAALTAFEAVARCQSYTRAAEELALTQSAVSRQIASLESLLNVALFEDNRTRPVRLTPAGNYFYERVRQYLGDLSNATAATISFNGEGRTLRLGIPVSFAGRWLIPRMGDFYARHPDITVEFVTRVGARLKGGFESLDASIEFAEGQSTDAVWRHLIEWPLKPVVSPRLLSSLNLAGVECLRATTVLLHTSEVETWRRYTEEHGLNGSEFKFMHFGHYTMLFQAAIAGLGVALAPASLIERELAGGELVTLPSITLHSGYQGYFVYPQSRRNFHPLRTFEQWLFTQVTE